MRQNHDQEKKIRPRALLAGLGIFVFGLLLAGSVIIYGMGTDNFLAQIFLKYIPYPAVFWKSGTISISELKKDLSSVKNFYQNQDFSPIGARVDFNTPEGKKRLKIKERRILNKLIENKLIEKEAKKRNVSISDEQISQAVEKKMAEYDSEEYLKNNLKKLYGWEIKDFEQKIVKPDMYRDALAEKIRHEASASLEEAKKQISQAENDLKRGVDFEDVAKEYSQGESAKIAGDLGWFSAREMLPEIAQVVFSLETGKISSIIESRIGYHIIRVEERKTENEEDLLKLRQIFVRTASFSDWLEETQKNLKPYVLIKGYHWNKQSGEVEFDDEELIDFEKNLLRNSPDDISIMF